MPIGPGVSGCALHYEGPHMGPMDHSRCTGVVRSIQAFHQGSGVFRECLLLS